MSSISRDELRFTLFPFIRRDEAKRWANSLEHREVSTWGDLIDKFMKKFFPSVKNVKRMQDLMLFKQRDRENLHDA